MRFGVMLAMLRAVVGKLLETVVSGFVASPRALPDRFDVLAHVTISLASRASFCASRQQEPSSTGPE
jgi:hypothetical protein